MLANIISQKYSLQQRRHDELTREFSNTAVKRDETIVKLCKLDAKLRDLGRKVGRSGKRLVETREALAEKPTTPIAPAKPERKIAKAKTLPVDGDAIGELLADKAAALRAELKGERARK